MDLIAFTFFLQHSAGESTKFTVPYKHADAEVNNAMNVPAELDSFFLQYLPESIDFLEG
jgi:hypothetical protein